MENTPSEDIAKDHSQISSDDNSDLGLLSSEKLLFAFGVALFTNGLLLKDPTLPGLLFAVAALGWTQLQLLKLQDKALDQKLFASEKWNDRIGRWLCFYPLFMNPEDHASIIQLHINAPSTAHRPRKERLLIAAIGLTGLKRLSAIFATNLGLGYVSSDGELKFVDRRTLNFKFAAENLKDNYLKVFLFHIALIVLSIEAGLFASYILWSLAFLTSFSFFLEIKRERALRKMLDAAVVIESGVIQNELPSSINTGPIALETTIPESQTLELPVESAPEVKQTSADIEEKRLLDTIAYFESELAGYDWEPSATESELPPPTLPKKEEQPEVPFVPGEVPQTKQKISSLERDFSQIDEDRLFFAVPMLKHASSRSAAQISNK